MKKTIIIVILVTIVLFVFLTIKMCVRTKNDIYKILDDIVNANHTTKESFLCASIGKKGFAHIQRDKYEYISQNIKHIKHSRHRAKYAL